MRSDRPTRAPGWRRAIVWTVVAATLPGCGGGGGETVDAAGPFAGAPATVALRSDAFEDGGAIPPEFTCDGADSSPPLAWSDAPPTTRSFALIVEDPDAPSGTFTHWTLYGLAANENALPEGVPARAVLDVAPWDGRTPPPRQGRNDFGQDGYGGPCPPSGTHHYVFQIYALDTMPDLAGGASKSALLAALRGHVLARGRLVGTYACR